MFFIFEAMSDLGLSGFFFANTAGAFTIGRDGFGWVSNDLMDMSATLFTGEDVAPSALVQGF